MIKVGTLLDACGIVYTEKQLAKLEELVTNLIETRIYETIQQLGKESTNLAKSQSKTSLQDTPKETSLVKSEPKV